MIPMIPVIPELFLGTIFALRGQKDGEQKEQKERFLRKNGGDLHLRCAPWLENENGLVLIESIIALVGVG